MWAIVAYIIVIIILVFVFKEKIYKGVKYLEYHYKIMLSVFFTMFISLILLPIYICNGKNVKNSLLMAEVSKHITKLLGVKWYLRNAEVVSEDMGAVIVINHQSALDLIGLCNFWYAWNKASCVVKKEVLYFWPFGLGLYLMDTIFIDRENPKDAQKVLQAKSNAILQNKIKILVFPEGTRNDDFTKLLPFKKGAFNVAVGAQVPIIPIVISRYYFLNNKKHIFDKGNVIAQCLEPVSTEGLSMDDVPELINRVQSNMEQVFKELSRELTSTLSSEYPLAKQD